MPWGGVFSACWNWVEQERQCFLDTSGLGGICRHTPLLSHLLISHPLMPLAHFQYMQQLSTTSQIVAVLEPDDD